MLFGRNLLRSNHSSLVLKEDRDPLLLSVHLLARNSTYLRAVLVVELVNYKLFVCFDNWVDFGSAFRSGNENLALLFKLKVLWRDQLIGVLVVRNTGKSKIVDWIVQVLLSFLLNSLWIGRVLNFLVELLTYFCLLELLRSVETLFIFGWLYMRHYSCRVQKRWICNDDFTILVGGWAWRGLTESYFASL